MARHIKIINNVLVLTGLTLSGEVNSCPIRKDTTVGWVWLTNVHKIGASLVVRTRFSTILHLKFWFLWRAGIKFGSARSIETYFTSFAQYSGTEAVTDTIGAVFACFALSILQTIVWVSDTFSVLADIASSAFSNLAGVNTLSVATMMSKWAGGKYARIDALS